MPKQKSKASRGKQYGQRTQVEPAEQQGAPIDSHHEEHGNDAAADANNEDIFTVHLSTLTGAKLKLQISKADSNIEIKQLLSESIETCYITSYELRVNNRQLEDFADISDYPEIKPDSTITMHAAPYDDKGARMHVYRLRELLDSKIDDMYLSTGSVEQLPERHVASFPSFARHVASETYNDLSYALNCDMEFQQYIEQNAVNQQQQKKGQEPYGNKKKDNSAAKQQLESLDSRQLFQPDNFSLKSVQSLLNCSSPKLPRCVKSIVFSGWNPPPGNRKLCGDLFYLLVETIEGKSLHITATPHGFVINNTTESNFDPNPVSKLQHIHHTLLGLLWEVSATFKKEFPQLLSLRTKKHPFEVTPVPFQVPKWIETPKPHLFDPNRAEEALFTVLGNDPRVQQREWNEEYQSCKELPSGTMEERIIRDRNLFKIHCDFVDAATKGAKAVIDKCLLPINPMDPKPAQVYIQNNIFFSFATLEKENAAAQTIDVDAQQQQSSKKTMKFEMDQNAYANADNDLKGVIAFNEADVRGIHTLASTIIDYRGYRVIAQSIIPGILQNDQGSKHVYGSIDDGKSFAWDEKYHKLMAEAAQKLHIKEHTILDKDNQQITLNCPVECKGILGSDGRFYVLDLVRVTPRDVNFKEVSTAVVRPELVKSFIRYKVAIARKKRDDAKKEQEAKQSKEQEARLSKEQEAKQSKDQEEKQSKDQEEKPIIEQVQQETKSPALPSDEQKKQELPNDGKQEPQQQTSVADNNKVAHDDSKREEELEDHYLIKFNPDVFTVHKHLGPLEEDEALVTELSTFLSNTVIPNFIKEVSNLEIMPMDGVAISETMHNKGINMRYLGRIASICESHASLAFLKIICIQEMIVRTARQEFNLQLRATSDENLGKTTTQFLNNFLGKPNKKNEIRTKIAEAVEKKYHYKLSELYMTQLPILSTVRSFCLRVGLRLQIKDYALQTTTPFTQSDILGIEPVVKHSTPRSATATGLLEVGRQQLNMSRFESAYEFLSQAIVMFQQVKGPMNREVATCFHLLATILFHASDLPQAILHQHKALVIYRRVLGFDHSIVVNSHQLLGMLCQNIGQPEMALKHFLRAKYLFQVASGMDHPDLAIILTNMAMLYQDLGDYSRCHKLLLEALRINEKLLGPDHLQTATVHHLIAGTLSLLKQYKEAMTHERKYYMIVNSQFGAQDPRALESMQWLEHFTAKAVQASKEKLLEEQDQDALRSLWKSSLLGLDPNAKPNANIPPEIADFLSKQKQQQQASAISGRSGKAQSPKLPDTNGQEKSPSTAAVSQKK